MLSTSSRSYPMLCQSTCWRASGPCEVSKKLFTLLDLCVSSLRRGHANLLCIVPILTDDPRRESEKYDFLQSWFPSRLKCSCPKVRNWEDHATPGLYCFCCVPNVSILFLHCLCRVSNLLHWLYNVCKLFVCCLSRVSGLVLPCLFRVSILFLSCLYTAPILPL